MTTPMINEETETSELESGTAAQGAPRRRRGAGRSTAPTSRRRRRGEAEGGDLVAELAQTVDQLIRENRELKRSLERAERQAQESVSLGQTTRVLAGLQRRLAEALESRPTGRGRAAAGRAAARPRRKVTDPDVLQRRREALAKARAALKAKREAAAE